MRAALAILAGLPALTVQAALAAFVVIAALTVRRFIT